MSRPNDDIMELLWQNGQVVMQSQNQRSHRKSPPPSKYDAVIPHDMETRSSQGQGHESITHHHQQQQQQHLFMQEDEMASWLHYPLVDDPSLDHNFCGADLLYPASTCANTTSSDVRPVTTVTTATTPPASASTSKPPIPPARTEMDSKVQNFVLFSRHKARVESGQSTSKSVLMESTTVVDSNDTPAVGPEYHALEMAMRSSAEASNANLRCGTVSGGGPAGTSTSGGVGGKEVMTCEMTVTSSPGGSSTSAELLPALKPPAEDRKRKGREVDETECQSEVSESGALLSRFLNSLSFPMCCVWASSNVRQGVDVGMCEPFTPLHPVFNFRCMLPLGS